MGQDVDVVLEADLLLGAEAEVLDAVLAGDADDGQDGQQSGDTADAELHGSPHLGVIEAGQDLNAVVLGQALLQAGILGDEGVDLIGVLRRIEGVVGDEGGRQQDGPDHAEDQGDPHGVEHGEDGALGRVVGQAGLSGLGDNTLAGIADDVHHVEDDEHGEPDAGGRGGDHTEHDEGRQEQDHVADDDEGTIFAELGVGLVNDHADERVGNAVPHTHDGDDGAGQNNADADDTDQVVGNGVHEQHVQVGGHVVQGEEADLPRFGAVNTVRLVFQRLLRHGFLLSQWGYGHTLPGLAFAGFCGSQPGYALGHIPRIVTLL